MSKPHPVPLKAEVAAGNVDLFMRALEREIGRSLADAGDGRTVSLASFAGLPVVKNDLLPPNMAAISVNGEVVQIIRFDPS